MAQTARTKKLTTPPDEVINFGFELRLARIKAKTYQKAVADQIGWHSTAISQLERGDRMQLPDFKTVQKLDKYLKAEGKLLEAAGYKVPEPGNNSVIHTIELPSGFTRAERNKVKEYIELLERARQA